MIVQVMLSVVVHASSSGTLHVLADCAGPGRIAYGVNSAPYVLDERWPPNLAVAVRDAARAGLMASLAASIPDWSERACRRCASG